MPDKKKSFYIHIPKNDNIGMEQNSKYSPFLQSSVTNSFTSINKKTVHKYSEEAQLFLFSPDELGINVAVKNNDLSLTTSKLIDVITLGLTKLIPLKATDEELTKFLEYDLSVQGYMDLLGLKDKKQAKTQLRKDLETLFNTSITSTIYRWVKKGRTSKKEPIRLEIRLLDAIPEKNTQIRNSAHIRIALSFLIHLSQHSQLMSYYLPILLQERNSNVYYIGKKLTAHYNMNSKKTNVDSISVNSLLKSTPDIPTIDEEKTRNRNYRQKCIEPLVKALDKLHDIKLLSEWHFMNEKKTQIPQEKLEEYATRIDDWKKLYVHFRLEEKPYNNKAIAIENK